MFMYFGYQYFRELVDNFSSYSYKFGIKIKTLSSSPDMVLNCLIHNISGKIGLKREKV